MWVFVCIPGILCVVTLVVETIRDRVNQYRYDHPYIGHLNYRDNRTNRY